MKKFIFLLAAMFAVVFANAQTIVNWDVMDSTKGTIDVIHPVVYYDTTTYDSSVVVYDTVGDVIDTNFTTVTVTVIDTIYNDNQWFLIAVPAEDMLFTYWVNEWSNSDTVVYDTVYSDFNLIDIDSCGFDSVMCIAYFMEPNSINEVQMENITVYPNPTTGIIRFSQPVGEFYLYDECGRPVMNGINANMIDMTKYNSGIYFIKTRNGISKIVKR